MRWAISWLLYWLGHCAWLMLDLNQHSRWWVGFWYPIYNNLMCASVFAQGGSDNGPWGQEEQK